MSNIIDYKDIARMRATAENRLEDTSKIERKEQLKKLSEDKVKRWPNTLDAMRLKKERFVKEREDEEEAKRQEIDRQEAEIRNTKRLESIERANMLIYNQTDKMKNLKSQLQYADVLHTRKSQIEVKIKASEFEKVDSIKHHEAILKEVERLDNIENDKIRHREGLVKAISKTREDQLTDVRARRSAIEEANYKAGIAMKEKAQRLVEDMQQADIDHQKYIDTTNASMVVANSKIKAERARIKEAEDKAMADREAEVEDIDNRKKALKALEKRRFEKSQETRQRMIDAAVEQLTKKGNKEAAIMQKQADEIRDRENKTIADKAARLEKQKQDIFLSREEQMKSRDDMLRAMHEEEANMIKRWKEQNEFEIQKEKDKVARAHKLVADIKSIQYSEGQYQQKKRVDDKLAQIERDRLLMAKIGSDDQKFGEICKSKIEEYSREGKTTYTIHRAMESVQMELVPAKLIKVDRKKKE